jgi:phage baseplate assembly protein W
VSLPPLPRALPPYKRPARPVRAPSADNSYPPVEPAFLGRGWSFPPTFDPIHNTVVMASGDVDIRESLHILLSTSLGERVMLATYGVDLISKVFTALTTTSANEIATMVTRAIIEWEPRVTVEKVDVSDAILDGWVAIAIDYVVRQTNARDNIVYPFYQVEATLPPPTG